MKKNFKPIIEENHQMIILGIVLFWLILIFCDFYFYLMHKISVLYMFVIAFVITLLYSPRFYIIKKLLRKDVIKITDDAIFINGQCLKFPEIKDFRVEEKKPVVIFFLNNTMIVYNEAKYYLRTENGTVSFTAIGSEKIKLLTEFLENLKASHFY